MPLVRVSNQNRPYFFSKSGLFKYFQTDSDTQMYLSSSALMFFRDWDFSLGHMSMDLSSVLAALSSSMVPSVTGTNNQVASPHGCFLGLAGPEPSGPLIYPGQHLHGSRGYLNVVPAGPTPPLGPLGTQREAVGTPEVTIVLPLCCATEALRRFPCSSPQCPRRVTIGCQGGQQCQDPSQNQPPDGWNQRVVVDGGALYDLGGTIIPSSTTPLERFEVDLMDFEVSGSGEVPNPTRPEQWAPWEPRLPKRDAHTYETACWVIQEITRREEEQEFDFLLDYFYLIRDEIYDRMYRSWEENQLSDAFHQVWNVMPFPKKKTWEAVPGPSAPHSAHPGRDAAAELAAAVEEGILEPAKQLASEIKAQGAPEVDSWSKSTDLCAPAACPAPAGHGMCCPVDSPCCTQRDSELQQLNDQMQSIVHTLGIKNVFKTHMRSEGASSVGKQTEPSEEATEILSLLQVRKSAFPML